MKAARLTRHGDDVLVRTAGVAAWTEEAGGTSILFVGGAKLWVSEPVAVVTERLGATFTTASAGPQEAG